MYIVLLQPSDNTQVNEHQKHALAVVSESMGEYMQRCSRSTHTYCSDFLELFRTDIRKNVCVSLCMYVCGCGCGCGGGVRHTYMCRCNASTLCQGSHAALSYIALLRNTLTSYHGSGADLGWWAQR